MSRKKTKSDEVVVVAQEIASVVAAEVPKKKTERASKEEVGSSARGRSPCC